MPTKIRCVGIGANKMNNIKAHKYITLGTYKSISYQKIVYYMNINLDDLIDHYNYHDAPSSVDLDLSKEEIENLIEKLKELIK